MIVTRSNYNNSGDFDILYSHSTDGGVNWNSGGIDKRSDFLNIPRYPEISGKKDRNKGGIYKASYYCGPNMAESFDSVFAVYYPASTVSRWSQFVSVNSEEGSVSYSPKPTFVNYPNDSCFTVWKKGFAGVYCSRGCSGIILPPGRPYSGTGNVDPEIFSLNQNYPNPFNPVTNISFVIPFEGLFTLKIFDVSGKEAAVLLNGTIIAGVHDIDFDGSSFASGVYFYRLESDNFSDTKKMMLIK
jgi:hypothetical protein